MLTALCSESLFLSQWVQVCSLLFSSVRFRVSCWGLWSIWGGVWGRGISMGLSAFFYVQTPGLTSTFVPVCVSNFIRNRVSIGVSSCLGLQLSSFDEQVNLSPWQLCSTLETGSGDPSNVPFIVQDCFSCLWFFCMWSWELSFQDPWRIVLALWWELHWICRWFLVRWLFLLLVTRFTTDLWTWEFFPSSGIFNFFPQCLKVFIFHLLG